MKQQVITVAALAHERILATSVTLPLEILRAAAQASSEQPRPKVRLMLVSQSPSILEIADGLRLQTTELDRDMTPDILLLPAIWRHPRWALHHHPWQGNVIRDCVAQGSWVCGVGSGSFLMAEAGVLDGGSATTHWQWFDDFNRRYPNIQLRRDQLITQHGRIFCVGSVNSIADLMVYIAGLLISRRSALAIENQFSPEIRRRFTPHSLFSRDQSHNDEQILDAQMSLHTNLQAPLNLKQLAASAGLTARTFSRRFKAAVGTSPGDYLLHARIEEARTLLHQSNLSVAEVGWTVGLRDTSYFSRQFRKAVGVTPARYRTAVRGKSFTADVA